MPPVDVDLSHPALSQPNSVWKEYVTDLKLAIEDFHERRSRLYYRATHPGGGGAERWRPLVKWYWPDYLADKCIRIIARESGGSPGITNTGGSGASGLFQLLPAPSGWWRPATNVSYAYSHKYLPSLRQYGNGWLPWGG